jgi:hypothetical protein
LNPLKELDELYSKDSRVPLIDLEVFANEHVKKLKSDKFDSQMKMLEQELNTLEPGKYSIILG